MENDGRVFASLGEARSALALDCGFDPFLHGGVEKKGVVYRRPTLVAMNALGYRVDPVESRRRDQKKPAEGGLQKWAYECDYRHRYLLTDAEAAAMGFKCKHGHPFV